MRNKKFFQKIILPAMVVIGCSFQTAWAAPGNCVDYAWSENSGYVWWANGTYFEGALVSVSSLSGYLWSEEAGYISLNCSNTGSCATVSYAVSNDGTGNLSGYAWSEKLGWISFDDTSANNFYQVTINPTSGIFSGYAWSEKIGWINLNDAGTLYGVSANWYLPTVTNSGGATDILVNSAVANGEVTNDGGSAVTVYLYWGDNDGGTTAGDWDNVQNLGVKGLETFFYPLTNLQPSTVHYYRYFAYNSTGGNWAGSSASFITDDSFSPTVFKNGVILKKGVILK